MTGCVSRGAIPEFIAQRQSRWTEQRARIDAARNDIRRGIHRGVVMQTHGLSITAYERLAAQIRGPWKGA